MSAVRTTAGLKPIAHIAVRNNVGDLKDVVAAFIRTTAGLKLFYSAFAVAVSDNFASGTKTSKTIALIGSNSVTATPVGGVGPYTYAWTNLGTGDGTTTAVSPAAASTVFRAPLGPGETANDDWVCDVTDASGTTVPSETVSVSLTNNGV